MSLAILGIGTATPERRIAQRDAAELATTFAEGETGHDRVVAAIYRQTRIRSRGSVLLDDPGTASYAQTFFAPASLAEPDGPSTKVRMDRYAAEAGPLAIAAAARALADAGIDASKVTHLVTCSCTGFTNPGVDLELVSRLGLPASVARTHVGFMGCHGAFNALRVAEAFVAVGAGLEREHRNFAETCLDQLGAHHQPARVGLTLGVEVHERAAAAHVVAVAARLDPVRVGRVRLLPGGGGEVLAAVLDLRDGAFARDSAEEANGDVLVDALGFARGRPMIGRVLDDHSHERIPREGPLLPHPHRSRPTGSGADRASRRR